MGLIDQALHQGMRFAAQRATPGAGLSPEMATKLMRLKALQAAQQRGGQAGLQMAALQANRMGAPGTLEALLLQQQQRQLH